MSTVEPHVWTGPARPRHLRLLSALWLPAAVLVGLTALAAARSAVVNLAALLTEPGRAPGVSVAGLLVGALAAAVLGRITWRLAVEVPRTVRAWDAALEERRSALHG